MINILAHLFIKDAYDYENESVRTSYGVLCGGFGIMLNILLFAGKFLAGSISGSIAITADAFNNLSDAGSSLITMIGFKMAGQKPDPDHPFGHGRIEYISGLLVSVVIILMSYELFRSSLSKILHPEKIEMDMVVGGILIVSILVKLYMAFYNYSISKKIESAAMRATATDSISDTVATSVVLIASVIGYFTGVKLDGYLGIAVAILVFWAGLNAAKDTVDPLLGQPPKREFVDKVENIVMSYKDQGVLGIHDLMVHDYGPGRVFLSAHVEVPADQDILVMHDMMDRIESHLMKELGCHAVIHMDPVCVGDPETDRLKILVEDAISSLNDKYSKSTVNFHDFRLVKGPTHTNLIFDIVLPFDYEVEAVEAVKFIQNYVNNKDNSCFCAINVDREYSIK